MAVRVDLRALAATALHNVVHQGERAITVAVRKAIAEHEVHESQLTLEDHDEVVNRTREALKVLSGDK